MTGRASLSLGFSGYPEGLGFGVYPAIYGSQSITPSIVTNNKLMSHTSIFTFLYIYIYICTLIIYLQRQCFFGINGGFPVGLPVAAAVAVCSCLDAAAVPIGADHIWFIWRKNKSSSNYMYIYIYIQLLYMKLCKRTFIIHLPHLLSIHIYIYMHREIFIQTVLCI